MEEGGTLKKDAQFSHLDVDVVIITMEAVLIEGLEPRQNRKRGDADFKAFEFLQVEDPEFEKRKKFRMLQEMMESSLLKNT